MTKVSSINEVHSNILELDGASGPVPVHIFDTGPQAVAYVTATIAGVLKSEINAKGHALWTGAGGSTPRAVYEGLSGLALDWGKITLTQVDERYVPASHTSSNSLMMVTALSAAVAQGLKFVPMVETLGDASACARMAETTLRALEGVETSGEQPIFDFTLLGMGNDAHFASIFPGHAAVREAFETRTLIMPISSSGTEVEPVLPRLTLTVSALNRSKRLMLLIMGRDKLDTLKVAIADTNPNTSPIGAFLAQCPHPVDIVWAA